MYLRVHSDRHGIVHRMFQMLDDPNESVAHTQTNEKPNEKKTEQQTY